MFFGSPRFRDLIPEFLAHQGLYSDDRRTTASNLRILARTLGDLPLRSIHLAQIEDFVAARIGAGVGRSTLNRQRATLSRFFSWAIGRGLHPGPNPVHELRKFRESPGRTRYLTTEEAGKLHMAAAHHLKPILVAALCTGGRLGELLALRWRDVDLEAGLVTFRKETTKSRKERWVPVSQDLAECLRSLRRGIPEDRIFSFRGEGLKSVRTAFARARKKAGLQDVHFHDLRHTFASWYMQNGGDLYRLQKYLGHASIAMTQRYAHTSESFLRDGVQYIGPPKSKSPRRGSGETEV